MVTPTQPRYRTVSPSQRPPGAPLPPTVYASGGGTGFEPPPPTGTRFTTENKYGPEGTDYTKPTGPTSITPERPDAGTGQRPPDGSIDRPPAPTPPGSRPKPPILPPGTLFPPPPPSPVGTNLREETYLPGEDPRLKSARQGTDAALAAINGFDRNGVQIGNEDRYRSIYGTGEVAGDFSALEGAPNRTELAKQALADFMAQQQEQQFNEERALGRNISKFGRSGLQSNADEFGDITRKIAGDRSRYSNELARSVAEGDIGDRFRTIDMKTGLAERNADRAFSRSQAAINDATGLTDRSVNDLFDRFNTNSSLEDRVFNQGQSNRNEYRTERGRQDTQAQQTIENRLKQMELENALEDMRLRRAALQAQAGGM